MILSDKTIDEIITKKGVFLVNPYTRSQLQPNSYDCSLGDELKTLDGESIFLTEKDDYELKPNEFILGSTFETVTIPRDLCGHVDGKSSIGRLGVFVHVSSGFIDSGFHGNITLEIYNCSNKTFTLKNGMSICQLVFETLTTPVWKLYGERDNHYQDSKGTVESKYEKL